MKRLAFTLTLLLLSAVAVASTATSELDGAALVIRNMTATQQIPNSILANAECVAVIPAIAKMGAIVGGKHGNGVVSCRTKSGWSAPAFITITGGSVGLQVGFERQDLVLLMNKQGEQELSSGHWTLGAEAVAIGPNKQSTGGLDNSNWKTPVLIYSSASGAYAGINLEGSKISTDDQTMRDLYGPNATLQTILGGQVQPPGSAQSFLAALNEITAKQ
jgi:lipid-binding SYLF domain-containing protein